jgi:exopolysaccharide biosynthesis polyprenyl glycosylphosphotransferase
MVGACRASKLTTVHGIERWLGQAQMTLAKKIAGRANFARSHRDAGAPRVTTKPNPFDLTRLILSEELFLGMLCLERKRAERSENKFTLILVDARAAIEADSQAGILQRIVKAVDGARRETDLAGWYKQDAILGVIFTELGDLPEAEVNQRLRDKLCASLAVELTKQELQLVDVTMHVFDDDSDDRGSDSSNPTFYPDLYRQNEERKLPLILKRAMDIVGSVMALVVLSPVFACIALAVKLTSKGPVLFRQTRIGQLGVPFQFLKFRSMYVSNNAEIHKNYVQNFIAGKAETNGSGEKKVFKITNDPRITSVGRFLRRTSLDELPQFWNVLKGEMSLVGPRPPVAYEIDAYYVWHRRRVLEAKPGITGLWQVHGRSKTTFDEMVRLDLRYSRTWSPLLDVKILLQTPGAVFSGDGAY